MTNAVKIFSLLNNEIRYYDSNDELLFAMTDVFSLFDLPKPNQNYAMQRYISENNRSKKRIPSLQGDRHIWFLRPEGIKEICFALPEKGVFILDAFHEAAFPCTPGREWPDALPDAFLDEYGDDLDELMEEMAELEEENGTLREKLEYATGQRDKALKALGISMLMDTPYEIYD